MATFSWLGKMNGKGKAIDQNAANQAAAARAARAISDNQNMQQSNGAAVQGGQQLVASQPGYDARNQMNSQKMHDDMANMGQPPPPGAIQSQPGTIDQGNQLNNDPSKVTTPLSDKYYDETTHSLKDKIPTPATEPPPPAPVAPADATGVDFNDPIQQQYDAELKALQEQKASSTAQAILGARAKGGLFGEGGSGAETGQENDIRNVSDRNETLAEADLAHKYRGEQIEQENASQQRDAFNLAMTQLEDEYGIDLNKDGKVGTKGLSPDDASGQTATGDVATVAQTMSGTGTNSDPYGGMGGASAGKVAELKQAGAKLSFDHTEQGLIPPFDKYVVATDQNGNVYKFVVDGKHKNDRDGDIASWFASLAG